MKITVDLPEKDLRDICRITGIRMKGPAIRQMLLGALMLERRKEATEKFLTGEWGVDLAGYEESKATDKRKAESATEAWSG